MRQHWQEPNATTDAVRGVIASNIGNGISPGSAQEWFIASEVAWGYGVHLGPPPTPVHDEIARRTKAGNAKGAADLQGRQSEAWGLERRAVERWRHMQTTWLPLPTPAEQATALRVQREAAEREARIEARTKQLVQLEAEAARVARTTAARRQAEKEIGS